MKRTRSTAAAFTLLHVDRTIAPFLPRFADKAVELTEQELAARMTRLLPDLARAPGSAWLRIQIQRLDVDAQRNVRISFAPARRLLRRAQISEFGGLSVHAAHASSVS